MFGAALRALTLESNSAVHADLLGLLRDIYVRLSPAGDGPREVLLSLPSVSPGAVAALEGALRAGHSPKEQRQAFKAFLQESGGQQLRALLPQKAKVAINNLSDRAHTRGAEGAPEASEEGPIGLAGGALTEDAL